MSSRKANTIHTLCLNTFRCSYTCQSKPIPPASTQPAPWTKPRVAKEGAERHERRNTRVKKGVAMSTVLVVQLQHRRRKEVRGTHIAVRPSRTHHHAHTVKSVAPRAAPDHRCDRVGPERAQSAKYKVKSSGSRRRRGENDVIAGTLSRPSVRTVST